MICPLCRKELTWTEEIAEPIVDTKIGQIIDYDKDKMIRLPWCDTCKCAFI